VTAYRPQYLWLVFAPFSGACAGAVVATVLVWVVALSQPSSMTASDVLAGIGFGLALGGIYGGLVGAGVGFVVGIPLVFLVGRHLPRVVARRRAYVLGAVLPPVTLLVGVVVLLDVRLSWPSWGDYPLWGALIGAAVIGSRLAGWLAGTDDVERPVS
jgi:hypothetical protein